MPREILLTRKDGKIAKFAGVSLDQTASVGDVISFRVDDQDVKARVIDVTTLPLDPEDWQQVEVVKATEI